VSEHQPFESWLFSPEGLSAMEQQALGEHLKGCETCQRLTLAVDGMESRLRAVPMCSPAAEFTTRWIARLEADKIQRKRRQTLWVMLVSIGGAVLLLFLAGWMLLPILKIPAPILLTWAYQIWGELTYFGNLGRAMLTISGALFSLMPLTVWVAILAAIVSLCAAWLITYQRLTSPRRVVI